MWIIKNGKKIRIRTPWDVMNEEAQVIIKANITSGIGGVGGDTPSSSGSAA